MTLTDKHIRKIAKGDLQTFKVFFEVLYRPLCKFCFSFVKDHDQAADIAQESMIKFWDSRQKHSNFAQAKVYLFTIAKNRSLNHLRAAKKFGDEPLEQKASNDPFIHHLMQEELLESLYRAIGNLAPQTRKIVELTLQGMSNEEIGTTLEISVNTVKTLKKNGYKKLKDSSLKYLYLLLVLHENHV